MQIEQVDDVDDGVSDDCQVATYPIICTEVSITGCVTKQSLWCEWTAMLAL